MILNVEENSRKARGPVERRERPSEKFFYLNLMASGKKICHFETGIKKETNLEGSTGGWFWINLFYTYQKVFCTSKFVLTECI